MLISKRINYLSRLTSQEIKQKIEKLTAKLLVLVNDHLFKLTLKQISRLQGPSLESKQEPIITLWILVIA